MEEMTYKNKIINFYTSLIKDKKELHLMSLGVRGGVYEMVDGDYFHAEIDRQGRVIVQEIHKDGNGALSSFLQTEMYTDILKIKRKYGAFSIFGTLVYAPPTYYDGDDTVTLKVSKYHKSRMGHLGTIIINKIEFEKETSPMDEEDCLAALKNYFNVHSYKGFRCYLKEDMAVTLEYDNVVEIPQDTSILDISYKLLPQLVSTHKSILNGKIDIDCCVKGYSFIIDSKSGTEQSFFNGEWVKRSNQYHEKLDQIISPLIPILKSDSFWKNELFTSMLSELNNIDVPKGVRETYAQHIIDEITMRSSIEMGNYIRMVDKIMSSTGNVATKIEEK